MADKISVLIDEETVQKRIEEVAEQINRDYDGKNLVIVCILKGGAFFMTELSKRLTIPVTFDFMQVSSYGNSTVHGDTLKIKKDMDEDIENKHVLIVEDIVDTGNTLHKLSTMLKDRKPASLSVCTLLDKPERREAEINVRYSCFAIPNEFVVGCGLDYAEKYRNLPYIGVIES